LFGSGIWSVAAMVRGVSATGPKTAPNASKLQHGGCAP